MLGDTVEIIDGEDDGYLHYTADMKLLIGRKATVIEETEYDVLLDIGDEYWGWSRDWLRVVTLKG